MAETWSHHQRMSELRLEPSSPLTLLKCFVLCPIYILPCATISPHMFMHTTMRLFSYCLSMMVLLVSPGKTAISLKAEVRSRSVQNPTLSQGQHGAENALCAKSANAPPASYSPCQAFSAPSTLLLSDVVTFYSHKAMFKAPCQLGGNSEV